MSSVYDLRKRYYKKIFFSFPLVNLFSRVSNIGKADKYLT